MDEKGEGRHSQGFEEFRGFQFSETFQTVWRRILERIQRFEILKALLLHAEPLSVRHFCFLLFLGSHDLTDN